MENETYDDGPSKAATEIKATLRRLVIATVVLFFLIIAGGVYTWAVSNQNKDALCAYRADLESRIKSSQDFLVKHPNGIPGVAVSDIQKSVDSQQHAVKAFKKINC